MWDWYQYWKTYLLTFLCTMILTWASLEVQDRFKLDMIRSPTWLGCPQSHYKRWRMGAGPFLGVFFTWLERVPTWVKVLKVITKFKAWYKVMRCRVETTCNYDLELFLLWYWGGTISIWKFIKYSFHQIRIGLNRTECNSYVLSNIVLSSCRGTEWWTLMTFYSQIDLAHDAATSY